MCGSELVLTDCQSTSVELFGFVEMSFVPLDLSQTVEAYGNVRVFRAQRSFTDG